MGNVRLSYSDADLNGAIDPNTEIIEENNYYPFGLKQKGYNTNISSNGSSLAQQWKYNGIELNESLELNLYEMSFRQYDPAIGRFTSIDPVTHFSQSPYASFDNNPVFWADPSGANSETQGSQSDLWGRSRYDENGAFIPPNKRGNKNNELFFQDDSQLLELQNERPKAINFNSTGENILNSIIEWAIYIRQNNEEKIYLSDVINIRTKSRGISDMFADAVGGNLNKDKVTVKYLDGYVDISYDNSYLKPNAFTDNRITDITFMGKLNGSKRRYDIYFSTYVENTGETPGMLALHFYGKDFYGWFKDKIVNPVNPVDVKNINLDNKNGGHLNIPLGNKN